jgi:YbgC/YbaW family acyl-CoA thioester hydrolase
MFTIKRKINFYDCDPAGILFYARLFEISHSVYEEMISSFKLKKNYWINDEFVVPIIKTDGAYFKPLRVEEMVTINLTVTNRKENSFELTYEWLDKSGELAAKARTVHVFVNKQKWVKIPMYEDIIKGLESHQRDVNL